VTVLEIDKSTREGTATFANGEIAHIVSHAVYASTNTWTGGTASVVSVYKFDDGSGFTLRWVSIYNVLIHRCTGLFSEGMGRFAGMTGSATGGGEPPGRLASIVLWTGAYELKN